MKNCNAPDNQTKRRILPIACATALAIGFTVRLPPPAHAQIMPPQVPDGPTGGDTLTATAFIQRVNTHGGNAPSNGCSALGDVGKKAFISYTAEYFFCTDHHDTDRR